MCAHMHTLVDTRGGCQVFCFRSLLFPFATGSLTEPGTCHSSLIGSQKPRDPPVSASRSIGVTDIYAVMPGFLWGRWELNTGPHDWLASALFHQVIPKPRSTFWLSTLYLKFPYFPFPNLLKKIFKLFIAAYLKWQYNNKSYFTFKFIIKMTSFLVGSHGSEFEMISEVHLVCFRSTAGCHWAPVSVTYLHLHIMVSVKHRHTHTNISTLNLLL